MLLSNTEFATYCQENLIPMSGQLALTGECNLRCIHCYRVEKNQELSTDQWLNLLDDLRDEGCLSILFTGGDLFMRDDICEIFARAHQNGFFKLVITNGTLITKERIDFLKSVMPIKIYISIYGDIAEVHDKVTAVKGSFDRSIATIRALKENGIPVVAKCLVMKVNAHRFAHIRDFFDDLDVRCEMSYMMTPKEDGCKGPLNLSVDEETLLDHFAEDDDRYPEAEMHRIGKELDAAPCKAWRSLFYVDSNGDVRPCMLHPAAIGNVTQNRFKDIWRDNQNPTVSEIRNMTIRDIPECSECEKLPFCNVCMAVSLVRDGRLGAVKEKCDILNAREKYVLQHKKGRKK